MPEPISLHPATSNAVHLASVRSASPGSLPIDLLDDVSRRLAFVTLIILVVSPANLIIAELTDPGVNGAMEYTNAVITWSVSLLVLYLARTNRIPPMRLLDIGLGYEVFVALVASQTIVAQMGLRPSLTWSGVAVWVLIYPVIVPNTPLRTAIASIAAAATEPLTVLLYARAGSIPTPTMAEFTRAMFPNLIAVVLAVAISKTMYGLGQKLKKARSMGSYKLDERLGEGGMGEVWKASHRMLARTAAVKLIHPEVLGGPDGAANPTLLKRFEREAQATAALRSPHTVELYDFGVANDGTLYYVMELLDGIDLATLVQQYGPQPPGRVAKLIRQACHSLYEAHLNGLVHRDIKPANIMTCRYGTDLDFVKVLDFGLVKRGQAPAADAAQLTQVGTVSGTPAFMPPEQAMADAEIDGRADIYGLGCVAYWLLTGKLVFPRSSVMAMVIAHATEEPPSLSGHKAQEIPQKLEDIVLACLAKDPDHRPQTAKALSKMLEWIELDMPWTDEAEEQWWAEREATKEQ
ncbi:MAG: serine/threonine-protein kinase [Gemmatimonadetes bacterium]|nr:serine/threonine-protein kinase [Gemmatimonadota bacterium]